MADDHIPIDAFGESLIKMMMERLDLIVTTTGIPNNGVEISVMLIDKGTSAAAIRGSAKIHLFAPVHSAPPPHSLVPG